MKSIQKLLRALKLEQPAIKLFFIMLGLRYGLKVKYRKDTIAVENTKQKKTIIISILNLPYLIDIIKNFDYNFNIVLPEKNEKGLFVDYSAPKLHTLSVSKVEFLFSSFPEPDDISDIYVNNSGLKKGDYALDLGAFCGATVYAFSKRVGDEGKVFTFEPDKKNYEVLKFNIQKHNLTNVVAYNKAMWSETTILNFQAEGNLGSAVAEVSSREAKTVSIESLSFNDFLKENKIDKVNFIKMDIEGSEVKVIESMKDYLKKHRTTMIVEAHKDKDGKSTQLKLDPIFKEANYKVEYIKQDGTDQMLILAS